MKDAVAVAAGDDAVAIAGLMQEQRFDGCGLLGHEQAYAVAAYERFDSASRG
jgi:hypothetical protein